MPLLTLLAAGCTSASSQPGAAADALPSAAELEQLLVAHDVPGIAVATLTRCEVDGVAVAGVAELQAGTPVTATTVFEAASLSKPVFAWLVLTLAEEGLVDLDRPIAQDFRYPRITDPVAYARITPRMVLSHRTGLPNWVDERTPFHQRSAPVPFLSEPGAAHSYSGEAYQLLQAFVEDRSGRSLQDLFHERLGALMPRSTFAQPLPAGVAPSRAYQRASRPDTGRNMTNLYDRAMAASSLVTTAEDFARFLAFTCRGAGLSQAMYDDMLTPHSPAPADDTGIPTAWGLGWMLADVGTGTVVGHGGNNDEFRAFAGFLRESGDGIVVLTNSATGQALIDQLIAEPAG